MNTFLDWLQQPLTYRLGWTLLHFLWQGSAIALALAVAQTCLKKRAAESCYAAACIALGLMALAPLATFALLSADTTLVRSSEVFAAKFPVQITPASSAVTARPLSAAGPGPANFLHSVSQLAEPILPWLTMLWFIGICLLSARLLGGWWKVQRLKRQQTEPLDEPWLSKLQELKQRLEITQPVCLLKSALVEVPTVIGWLKPVILLPASTLIGLSPGQLESILAHELAHIRRNDYLVNLIQRVIETVLFYHPAVWWVSNSIRQEREHCCDDLAVRVCGDRLGYARALASLEELRSLPTELALAADGGSLMQRIQRLVQKSPPNQGWSWRRITALLIIATSLCLVAVQPNLVLPPQLYRSTVRIELSGLRSPPERTFASASSEPSESDELSTELAMLTSRSILDKVIEDLNLGERFARRYRRQAPLSTSEVYSRLRQDVSTRVFPHTTLVEIAVVSENPQEAADIANRIVDLYRDTQQERNRLASIRSISILTNELSHQEAELKKAQADMDHLRAELGVVGIDLNGLNVPTVESEIVRNIERTRAETEIALNSVEALLRQLTNAPLDEIALIIATNAPVLDNRLIELRSRLELAIKDRTKLAEEIGPNSPRVAAVDSLIAQLREQLAERVQGITVQLQAEVNRNRDRLIILNLKAEQARRNDAELMRRYRPFLVARSNVETKKRIYETINLRLLQETVDAKLPKRSGIKNVERAEPASRPIGRRWFWRN